jgi:hypothetical protein
VTDLVATSREQYPTDQRYGGNRSIILMPSPNQRRATAWALALTFHLNRRKAARSK